MRFIEGYKLVELSERCSKPSINHHHSMYFCFYSKFIVGQFTNYDSKPDLLMKLGKRFEKN